MKYRYFMKVVILVSHILPGLLIRVSSLSSSLLIQPLECSFVLQACYTSLSPFPQAVCYDQLLQTFPIFFFFFLVNWPLVINWFGFSWNCSKQSWKWLVFPLLFFPHPSPLLLQLCGRLLVYKNIYIHRHLWYRTSHGNNVIWSARIKYGSVP